MVYLVVKFDLKIKTYGIVEMKKNTPRPIQYFQNSWKYYYPAKVISLR